MSDLYKTTREQGSRSALLLACEQSGRTEAETIEILFREQERMREIINRLAAFQPMPPIVAHGLTWTNPTAQRLAKEGHERTLERLKADPEMVRILAEACDVPPPHSPPTPTPTPAPDRSSDTDT